MNSLALTRELTALADTARAAAKGQSKKRARALLAAAEALEAERAALPRLDVEAARTGINDLLSLAQVWPEPSARQIKKGAKRLARKARDAFSEGRGEKEITARHEWRKREKDRLFAVMLLEGAWPEKRRQRRCERVGDLLGKERDTLLLGQRIAANPDLAGTPKSAKRARRALGKRAGRLSRQADRLGKRLHADGA